MRLVFTKVDYFKGEDLITWGLEEPVSHMGIEFDNGEILHSSILSDVEFTTKLKFYNRRIEVLSVDIPGNDMFAYYEAKKKLRAKEYKYDLKYMWFLVKQALLLKLFRKRISDGVNYESPDSIICHEILEFIGYKSDMFDQDGANTPYRLYLKLKAEGL